MKRFILFLLVGALLLLPLSGCLADKQNEETTPANTTENTTPEVTMQDSTNNPLLPENTPFENAPTTFTADLFAKSIYLSWEYSLVIKFVDGKLFLNNILYSITETIDNPNIIYPQELLLYIEAEEDSDKKNEILGKIQNSKTCYFLESEADSKYGKEILVYYIDGIYYFLNYSNGSVTRIHCADVKLGGKT